MNSRLNLTGKSASTSISSMNASSNKISQHANINRINGLNMQKRRYESRLLLCHKDLDPLKAWYEYITWIESEYDENDESSGLKNVIERCVAEYINEKLYSNDKRFLQIFIKYAKQICDPVEVFSLMYSEGRFTKLADFYINWSWKCEDVSDYAQAERVLELAIENQAKPEKLISIAKEKLAAKLEIATINFKNDTIEVPAISSIGCSLKINTTSTSTSNKSGQIATSNSSKTVEPVKIYMDEPEATQQTIKPKANKALKLTESVSLAKKQEEEDQVKKKAETVQTKKPPPKVVIMEQLAPNQRFHADLKRTYNGDTEYSFEEIRFRKWLASKKRDAEKQVNQKLCNEIAELRQALATKEQEDKQTDYLRKELETLKAQFNCLIQRQNESVAEKRAIDEYDGPPGKKMDDTRKRAKLTKTSDSPLKASQGTPNSKSNKLRERKNLVEKEVTLVRELWNGSIANYSEVSDDTKPVKCGRVMKDFSIFKDPTMTNLMNVKDASVNPLNFTTQDAFTIALPQDASEFRAKFASTPAPSKFR